MKINKIILGIFSLNSFLINLLVIYFLIFEIPFDFISLIVLNAFTTSLVLSGAVFVKLFFGGSKK